MHTYGHTWAHWCDVRTCALPTQVHIIKAVYDMGFNVMSVDIDTTWWRDPLPWLQTQVGIVGKPRRVFASARLLAASHTRAHGDWDGCACPLPVSVHCVCMSVCL